jgi:hypothetical protein
VTCDLSQQHPPSLPQVGGDQLVVHGRLGVIGDQDQSVVGEETTEAGGGRRTFIALRRKQTLVLEGGLDQRPRRER